MIFDVREFGAAGDGSDATTQIQAAIDAAQQVNGEVYVPAGVFELSARLDITEPVMLRGSGWGSILRGVPGNQLILLRSMNLNQDTPIMGVTVRDLQFDSNFGGQLDGAVVQMNNAHFLCDNLYVRNGTNANPPAGVNGIAAARAGDKGIPTGTISNCLLDNFSKAPINWTTKAEHGVITGNVLRHGSGTGRVPGIQVNGGWYGKVVGNHVEDFEGIGIAIGTGGDPPHDSENTIVANNTVVNVGHGGLDRAGIAIVNAHSEELKNGKTIITGNHVSSALGKGILVQNQARIRVDGNYVRECGSHGISVELCEDVGVCNNTTEHNNVLGQTPGSGISVYESSNVLISGNTSIGQNYAFLADDTSERVQILNNQASGYQINLLTHNSARGPKHFTFQQRDAAVTPSGLLSMRLPFESVWHIRAVVTVIELATGNYGVHRHEVSVSDVGGVLPPPIKEVRGNTTCDSWFESSGDYILLKGSGPAAEWRLDLDVSGL